MSLGTILLNETYSEIKADLKQLTLRMKDDVQNL